MPMNKRHNPNPRRSGYSEDQRNAITPLENLKPEENLKVGRNPSQQTQAHADYRNSDDYQEELRNRAAVTDSIEKAHLATLSQSGRKYSYKRSMENSSPSEKVAADNTRVTPDDEAQQRKYMKDHNISENEGKASLGDYVKGLALGAAMSISKSMITNQAKLESKKNK